MHHNLVPRLGHCVHTGDKQITSDRLHNILDEFPAVDFQPIPLTPSSGATLDDRRSTPLIFTKTWLHIRQPPT
ncbi:hypothetical protein ACQX2R_08360 [Corynebacterium diphtheriae]|nr:hypothetical protein [Corynebacterium diphtheriae]